MPYHGASFPSLKGTLMKLISLLLLVLVIGGIVILTQLPSGCELVDQALRKKGAPGDPTSDKDWTALKQEAMKDVLILPGWAAPRLLPGKVNSTGWEDSASISADGKTLTFSYIPCDFLTYVQKEHGRPDRFQRVKRGPARGVTPAFSFNTMISQLKNGSWTAPKTASISKNTHPSYQSETGLFLAGRDLYYSTNNPTTETDFDTNIYKNGKKLPFNSRYQEDDPHYINGEIFFWSGNRPGGLGGKDIWMVRQTGKNWSTPVVLASPVNTSGSDSWQPHLTAAGDLYFTSNREGLMGIYKSHREGPNRWSRPVRVVWPRKNSHIIGVAEPTLTGNRSQIYFCVLFKNQRGSFDLDIAFAERK